MGITIKAGPGKTTIASPISSTVKPIIAIISLFACIIVLPTKAFTRKLLFYVYAPGFIDLSRSICHPFSIKKTFTTKYSFDRGKGLAC